MLLEFLVDSYYLLSCTIILLAIMIVLLYYSRRLDSRELVTIVSLSSLIALSRGAFFWVPQVKPVSALVLVTGSVFGSIPGMLVGILSGFLSNFIFGQGPWTPFQMFAWGLIGFIGGSLRKADRVLLPMVVGFLSVLTFYGVLLNFASMLMMCNELSLQAFVLMELSGFPFDLIHAGSTVVFIYFVWKPYRRKLFRLQTKYHILKK